MSVGFINSSCTQLPLFVRSWAGGTHAAAWLFLFPWAVPSPNPARILVERGADFHGFYLV